MLLNILIKIKIEIESRLYCIDYNRLPLYIGSKKSVCICKILMCYLLLEYQLPVFNQYRREQKYIQPIRLNQF